MTSLLHRAPSLALIALVRCYQYSLAAFFGPACRYEPSCSHYAVEAIRGHGALGGSWLAVKRILRCNPWGGSGYDPVPPPEAQPGCDHHQLHGRG